MTWLAFLGGPMGGAADRDSSLAMRGERGLSARSLGIIFRARMGHPLRRKNSMTKSMLLRLRVLLENFSKTPCSVHLAQIEQRLPIKAARFGSACDCDHFSAS